MEEAPLRGIYGPRSLKVINYRAGLCLLGDRARSSLVRERERDKRRGRGVNGPFIIQHRRGLAFQRLVDDALSLLSRRERRLSCPWTTINGRRINRSFETEEGRGWLPLMTPRRSWKSMEFFCLPSVFNYLQLCWIKSFPSAILHSSIRK